MIKYIVKDTEKNYILYVIVLYYFFKSQPSQGLPVMKEVNVVHLSTSYVLYVFRDIWNVFYTWEGKYSLRQVYKRSRHRMSKWHTYHHNYVAWYDKWKQAEQLVLLYSIRKCQTPKGILQCKHITCADFFLIKIEKKII